MSGGKLRENIMKMCHQHTILIFNLALSPSPPSPAAHTARICFPSCSSHKQTHFLHSLFVLKMLPHSYVYQMLEPLRDERKLNAENLDVLQSNYAVAAVGRHSSVESFLGFGRESRQTQTAHGLNVTTSKSLNLCGQISI